jgi:hypothetical protein
MAMTCVEYNRGYGWESLGCFRKRKQAFKKARKIRMKGYKKVRVRAY